MWSPLSRGPKPYGCVDKRVVEMLQQRQPRDPIQRAETFFSVEKPGSPLPWAVTQIQEAFQLPGSEQEIS